MPESAAATPQSISIEAYRQDLDRLHNLLTFCAQQLPSTPARAKACDPAVVGPDVLVSIPGGTTRRVGYEWLRENLRRAEQSKGAPDGLEDGLKDASARLLAMKQEAASLPRNIYVPGNVTKVRRLLDEILDGPDYPQEKPPSFLERLWLDFRDWLFKTILSAMPRDASSTSIGILELAVIALPCGLLIWWFIRKLTVQKLDLAQDSLPHASAPSARPWDEWLRQAQTMAGDGRWREAIHHVYWAAISRLESRRFWPADRARTPREYLELLPANPETHADLFSLTRSFERTWYGATPAFEKDYDLACTLLEKIAAR
ncbi:MAG: DUF4129 domain-containing protein [Acidobacteriaceae bacterium]